jgi:anti-sigma B factor antagonist
MRARRRRARLFQRRPCQEQLNTALNHGAIKLVLDLQATTFVDSTGLALVISTQQRIQAAAGWLRLVSPQPQLRRSLHTTNLEGHFDVYPDLAQAVTAP